MTFEKLGVSVETVTPQSLREDGLASGGVEGLRVTDVAPGRSSSEKLRGMIITEVERPGPRKTIRSEADLEAVLARVRDGDVITVRARGLERGRDGRPTLSAPLTLNIRVGQQ
jgi:hypothetical protein